MNCLDCFYALTKDDGCAEILLCEVTVQDVLCTAAACANFLALDADICFNCFHADIDDNPQVLCRKKNERTIATTAACKDFSSGLADICTNCYHTAPGEAVDYTMEFCTLQKIEIEAIATCENFISINSQACFNCKSSRLPENLAPNSLFCQTHSKLVQPELQACAQFFDKEN